MAFIPSGVVVADEELALFDAGGPDTVNLIATARAYHPNDWITPLAALVFAIEAVASDYVLVQVQGRMLSKWVCFML